MVAAAQRLRKAFGFLSNTTADQAYLEDIRDDNISGVPVGQLNTVGLVAVEAGARVVGVDYRLAPEHPFPAGLSDAFTVYQELIGSAMGHKPENIAIAGDSAGGGMVFALLLMIQQRNLLLPGAAGALSPWVGLRESLLGNAALMFRKLRAGGQCAFFSPWVGMWHVFQTSAASGATEAIEAQKEMGQFFARHLGKAASSAAAQPVDNVCCW
eukprot:gene1053-1389_t